MTAPTCRACRFWRENESHRDPNDEGWGFGQCRRRGPIIVEAMFKAIMPAADYRTQIEPVLDDVEMTTASLWPATHSSDWCGEFQAAAEQMPA